MNYIRKTLLAVAMLLLAATNTIETKAAELQKPIVIIDPIKSVEKSLFKFDARYTTTPGSKEKTPVESVTYYLDPVYDILSEEYVSPDWDYRKRIQDIDILTELLVNQLGVSKTKAAAIIGNVVFEDSFISTTSSKARVNSIEEANERLGRGTRGFGIAQWTAGYRQQTLLEYLNCASSHLDWEMAAIVAETTFLYNELKYSNILGDLSEEGDIENCTGIIGVRYEGYRNHINEWTEQNGSFKSIGSPRFSYACDIYNYMVK